MLSPSGKGASAGRSRGLEYAKEVWRVVIIADADTEQKVFAVLSRSEPPLVHFTTVDYCTCKGFQIGRARCWHQKAVSCVACGGLGTTISYPALVECRFCGGSGEAR